MARVNSSTDGGPQLSERDLHGGSIETFFKRIKCIAGCRHLLLESQQGVASQLYCACILALLLTIATGRSPTKRHWELIQFHLMGWATADELFAGLGLDEKPA